VNVHHQQPIKSGLIPSISSPNRHQTKMSGETDGQRERERLKKERQADRQTEGG